MRTCAAHISVGPGIRHSNTGISREQACYPAGAMRGDKYWVPVNRVDNVHGDRHLICTCPPLEAYEEA